MVNLIFVGYISDVLCLKYDLLILKTHYILRYERFYVNTEHWYPDP